MLTILSLSIYLTRQCGITSFGDETSDIVEFQLVGFPQSIWIGVLIIFWNLQLCDFFSYFWRILYRVHWWSLTKIFYSLDNWSWERSTRSNIEPAHDRMKATYLQDKSIHKSYDRKGFIKGRNLWLLSVVTQAYHSSMYTYWSCFNLAWQI